LTETQYLTNRGKLHQTFAEYRIVYFTTSTLDPSQFSRKFDLSRQYIGSPRVPTGVSSGCGTFEPEIGTSRKNQDGWQS